MSEDDLDPVVGGGSEGFLEVKEGGVVAVDFIAVEDGPAPVVFPIQCR